MILLDSFIEYFLFISFKIITNVTVRGGAVHRGTYHVQPKVNLVQRKHPANNIGSAQE